MPRASTETLLADRSAPPAPRPASMHADLVRALPFAGVIRSLATYRALIYACTFLGGAAALIFQVVWQRYLALLLGSEARSISLVVAVFLLGLATGYRFWGALTQRDLSRHTLLRTLGFIELTIAVYALLFPWLFPVVRSIAYAGPDALALDLLWTALLLLTPTFLMGASIPLLTAVVPEKADEVNLCHAKIYGINTLGAFAGALIAGFSLVPELGLVTSLAIGAALGIVAGTVFVFNRLQGSSHKAEDVPHVPNRYGRWGVYLFVFTTGAVSIALEVLFARVLALSIGPLHVVFPIVVSVVILGLAIGSLTLRRGNTSAARVPAELAKLSVLLALLYLSVPYWPYWLSCVRVSLTTIPGNYGVFLTLVVIFTALLLLPVFIPLGRLLPMGYALIDKTRDDYGDLCGRVYFANTLGTVAGAVGLGYALFWVMDMPWVFKITLTLPLALAALLCARSGWRSAAIGCACATGAALLLPGWNRVPHVAGIYRMDAIRDFHFTGVFVIPSREGMETHLVRDDPGVTVAAFSANVPIAGVAQPMHSTSVTVNGKSDGNTAGDYSNMVLAGILPYLYAPRERDLSIAVVGLGTGLTSGAAAGCGDACSVTTLEISPGVIEAARFCNNAAFDLFGNPKSHIVRTDAFRFFARTRDKFDIIVSEPSNVWVVGIENLFTPEFYRLVNGALADDGVFFQWFQIYEMDADILGAIAVNVLDEFPHASLFAIGPTDVGILASRSPISHAQVARRLAEPHVRQALAPIGIDNETLLSLMVIYPPQHLAAMAYGVEHRRHSVESPWIGPAAGKFKFLRTIARFGGPVMDDIGRHIPVPDSRRADFATLMARHHTDLSAWCSADTTRFAANGLCVRLQQFADQYRLLREPTTLANIENKITAYGSLREQGFIDADVEMLAEATDVIRAHAQAAAQSAGASSQPVSALAQSAPSAAAIDQAIATIVREYANEWQWDAAMATAQSFRDGGLISNATFESLRDEVMEIGLRGRERAQQLGAALEQRRQ